MSTPRLTIRKLEATPILAPAPVPMKTASGVIDSAPLVLVDIHTEEGITGRSYLVTYMPFTIKPVVETLNSFAPLIEGRAAAPAEIDHHLRQSVRLLGDQGFIGMAFSGIDMALWDALSKAAGLPLADFLGGDSRRRIPAYDSLWLLDLDEVEEVLGKSLEKGYRAVKIKLGHENAATDVEVTRRGREVLGPDVKFMVDYNQSLSVPEAIRRIRMLEEFDLYWVEEPVHTSDHAGHAAIREAVNSPIQTGENWWGLPDMIASVRAGASDMVMPDVMKIGGVTGWMRAAGLAQAHTLPLSNHLFAEVSAHMLAAVPAAEILEYLDIASNVLAEPLVIENGEAVVPERPGNGLDWDTDAVAKHRLD